MNKAKELVHAGNVRRITVKNDEGHVLVVFPLTAGVVGAVLALAANCTIVIERIDEPPKTP